MTPLCVPARAGDCVQASTPELPAAIAKTTPLSAAALTASSTAVLTPPPRLILATAGFTALALTQSMPLMTSEYEPDPLHPRTLTAVSGAPGTMPTTSRLLSRAATVPATCVPWPLQSLG